jgi:hypothetical protein
MRDIRSAEIALNTEFPIEFRDFLLHNGGGYFAFTNVCSVNPRSQWSIVERNRNLDIPQFVAVSDNGMGDFYGFRVRDGKCQPEIWFADHEDRHLKPTPFPNFFAYLLSMGLRQKGPESGDQSDARSNGC